MPIGFALISGHIMIVLIITNVNPALMLQPSAVAKLLATALLMILTAQTSPLINALALQMAGYINIMRTV